MLMALAIFHNRLNNRLTVIAAYESGHTTVHALLSPGTHDWVTTYRSKAHTQPILSLDMLPDQSAYFTSGADAVIARHPLLNDDHDLRDGQSAPTLLHTGHAGQQALRVRGDGHVLATAGWDGRVRVYAAGRNRSIVNDLRELAVLRWHKEGCYAVAFGDVGAKTTIEVQATRVSGGGGNEEGESEEGEQQVASLESSHSLTTARQRRGARAQTTHWLAAGSKDGKVSLWDIY